MRVEFKRDHTPKRSKKNPLQNQKHKEHYGMREDLNKDHEHHSLFELLDEHLEFEGWSVSLSTRADGKIIAHIKDDDGGKLYQQSFDPLLYPSEDEDDTKEWDDHVASQIEQVKKWLARHSY